MPSRPKSREKNTPKALTGEVLQELADLANVPDAQQKSFFESVRLNVQAAWDLDAIVKGGLANEKGTTLHQAALTLYANLGKLNNSERALVERILSNANFVFDRISSGGLEGLWKTTYQIARLLSLLTDKTPPRDPHQRPQSRQGGRGTFKHPRLQKFVCGLLLSTTAAGGNLTANAYGGDGTLFDAIKMLSPHLPDGFNLSALSLITFQRLKTRCARLAGKQTWQKV